MNYVNFGQLPDFIGHKGPIDSIAFSFDNKLIASGGRDKKIKIWNIEDGELLTTLST